MESQHPPPPPPRQIKDGKMAKWLVDLGGRTITFWRGEGGKWKIFTCKYIFFYMDAAPAANDFFVCVSVFLQTL